MIEVGQPAPDFTLPDQNGEARDALESEGTPVVLYFYPKDDTPGCTTEACAFRDARAEYGGGREGPRRQPRRRRRRTRSSPRSTSCRSPSSPTPRSQVCQAYGVWKEKSMYGKKSMGVERTTFVIDGDGVVRKVFPKVKVDGHSDGGARGAQGLSG